MDKIIIKALPQITSLKQIFHPKGDIYHAMKASDIGFNGFGEVYFTTVHYGETKGWKKHTKMHMNLVVPVGKVCFYLHEEATAQTTAYTLGPDNYARLTVPPGYWMAFCGMSTGMNLVCNLASIEHNPIEAVNVPLETFPLETA